MSADPKCMSGGTSEVSPTLSIGQGPVPRTPVSIQATLIMALPPSTLVLTLTL